MARNTVLAAYDLLIADGYVIPRAGAKAVVVDVTARRAQPSTPLACSGVEFTHQPNRCWLLSFATGTSLSTHVRCAS